MQPVRSRSPHLFGQIFAACLIANALLSFVSGQAVGASPIPGLKITHLARALQPGEVVLITFESPKPLRKVDGSAFGKTFPFYADRNSRIWQGLIGIDLGVKPGNYTVRLQCIPAAGTPFGEVYSLDIRDKKFPIRRLTVAERFVTPPKEEEARINRESKRTEEIFATVTPAKLWNGPFAAPVDAPAGSSFGRRSILNGKPRSPHTGTDFSAGTGTLINAPNSGRVALAAELYFSGNTVIIDHGLGLFSFLAHLSQFSVREGDEVISGAAVGRVGATGRATGPHLHWSVRLAGTRVDPLSLIAALSVH